MIILYTSNFLDSLEKKYNFIAINNPSQAKKFSDNLKNKIEQIPYMPFAYRKNTLDLFHNPLKP